MIQSIADIVDYRFGCAREIGEDISAADLLGTLLSRRTVRNFNADPVPEPLLRVLLACAQSACSKSDLQQYAIIRIESADKRSAVAGLMPDMPWVGAAPVFMVYCGDIRRGQRISQLRGLPNVSNTLDSFMNAAVDAALAMQAFMTAAEASGLGCCPISAVREAIDEIGAILELPAGVFPVSGLCVGYPATAGHMSMRLPPAVTVHTDRYDDGTLESELAAYDERREQRHRTTPERQLHVDRFGVSEGYGWTENVARRLAVRERERFRPWLEEHGFDLS